MNDACYIPFTEDAHNILIKYGYLQLRNFGPVAVGQHMCDLAPGSTARILNPTKWAAYDDAGRRVPHPYTGVQLWNNLGASPAPADFKITDTGIEYPITSEHLKQMYSPVGGVVFYVMLDVGNNEGHRAVYEELLAAGAALQSRQ